MALGKFVNSTKKAYVPSGKFNAQAPENHNRPLLVVPREFRAQFSTGKFDPRDVILVDVVDLDANKVIINVLWGGAALVGRLKHYVPGGKENPGTEPLPYPIQLQTQPGEKGSYAVPMDVDAMGRAKAAAWDMKFGMAHIDAVWTDAHAKAEAELAELERNQATGQANLQSTQSALPSLNTLPTQRQEPAPVAQSTPGAGYSDSDLAAAMKRLEKMS